MDFPLWMDAIAASVVFPLRIMAWIWAAHDRL